jgi:hypothetical protein
MIPTIVVAAVLLTGEPDNHKQIDCDPDYLLPALKELSIEWELLDPREYAYMFVKTHDFNVDVNIARRRYESLGNAPTLSDAHRFPPKEFIYECLTFNRRYRECILNMQNGDPTRYWEYQAIIEETDWAYGLWDAARDSRVDYYYVTMKRERLQYIRDKIGYDNFYRGILPPHVPIHHMKPLK